MKNFTVQSKGYWNRITVGTPLKIQNFTDWLWNVGKPLKSE